jgi:diadenylate cyclase
VFYQIPNLIYQYTDNFIKSLSIKDLIEIAMIIIVIIVIYRKIIGTQAEQLLRGISMLLFALFLSKLYNSRFLGPFLESVVNIIVLSLVVIFQPELRRLLGYLGQPGIISKNIFNTETEVEVKSKISEISEAVKHLSKSHIGALIVIQNDTDIENYIEVGTKINATISTELLLTIFHPNTPLHDGAVIISGDKVLAAGVLLPLTEDPKLSWQYGTRHRAAIGMSEATDAACIVVSEETGDISMAMGGTLNKFVCSDELKVELDFLYGCKDFNDKKSVKERFNFTRLFSKKSSKSPVLSGKSED